MPRPSVKRKGVALRLIVKNLAGTNYLTGTDYLLEMWTSDTVLHVKEMIEDVDGIPASQQRLIQNDDELLDDGNTLGFYNIKTGEIIQLALNLRGDSGGGKSYLEKIYE